MQKEFKQSHKHPRFYVLCVWLLLTLVSYILSKNILLIIFIGCITPFIVPYFLIYRITDDGTLTGGCSVPVKSIRKIVYQKDRIDIYFQVDNKQHLTFRAFFPVDKQDFVDTLVAINPEIKVV